MKNIFMLFIGIFMMLALSSCEMYTSIPSYQDDVYESTFYNLEARSTVTFDIIYTYGIPYWYDGRIIYWYYDNLYYYPYWYDNYWYVRPFRKPFPRGYRPMLRPHRDDFRFDPGRYRGFERPRGNGIRQPRVQQNPNDRSSRGRTFGNRKPNNPTNQQSRPVTTPRSNPRSNQNPSFGNRSTLQSMPNRSFGGNHQAPRQNVGGGHFGNGRR